MAGLEAGVCTSEELAETMNTNVSDNGQTFQRIGHGILKLWLEKSNGEWKFAGRAD